MCESIEMAEPVRRQQLVMPAEEVVEMEELGRDSSMNESRTEFFVGLFRSRANMIVRNIIAGSIILFVLSFLAYLTTTHFKSPKASYGTAKTKYNDVSGTKFGNSTGTGNFF